ncbi:MAG: bifunctional 2-C-methyl-D-erythritol 4-phosphate cytidylyltransferase/2-C-methyl-D-erythritol 2,4-cyclodiphosphate synthase [Rhodospirillales bacterium]
MSGCIALVVAAGRGRRFGSGKPKQYCELGSRPMVRYSLISFLGHQAVDLVRPVIHPDDRDLFAQAARGLDLLDPVFGGASRQESVRLGLESLSEMSPERVLIHDAARPFVDHRVISSVLEGLDESSGAIPALPVSDTLKRGEGGRCVSTVERQGLWRAQTPQGFRFVEILEAHRRFEGTDLTDDAAVAEQAGIAVELVQGSEENVKITTTDDLVRVRRNMEAGEVRVGTGFDVHRFGPGDRVVLCGVSIPFEAGLEGFSDADVGLHALTDALLGAIGAGDIGTHFPPGETEWKDAPSEIFLEKAGQMIGEKGGRIVNLDLTLICEAPRIGPHRQAMIGRIAEILSISPGRISIKATTTEGLGPTGRGEGIAAQAVAGVSLPYDA